MNICKSADGSNAMKNILILNAGTRNRLIKDFKADLNGQAKVIATDSYYLAPALYEADRYYVTKRWNEKEYWDEIDEICRKNEIGLILSLVDPELELLAMQKNHFRQMGIMVNIGESNVIHNCFDKWETFQFLQRNGYPYIKTYNNITNVKKELGKGNLSYPLFAKPRCGSGSAGIQKIENESQLNSVCGDEVMIQEYMSGQELGVDVYVDLISGEVISIFAKKKLKMRAGETDKSVSYKNEKLFATIEKFCKEFGLVGANDIDVFEQKGEFYISEVNPRFGGGYLHAYECGERFPLYLINNMNGIMNTPRIGQYESDIYMMKYFDIRMMKMEE